MPFGVRHQSACATRQSAASCSAAVAGIRVSGYRAGHRRSRSGVAGRSIGGAEPVGPVFHPSNGEAHRNQSPLYSGPFNRDPGVRLRGRTNRWRRGTARCALRPTILRLAPPRARWARPPAHGARSCTPHRGCGRPGSVVVLVIAVDHDDLGPVRSGVENDRSRSARRCSRNRRLTATLAGGGLTRI